MDKIKIKYGKINRVLWLLRLRQPSQPPPSESGSEPAVASLSTVRVELNHILILSIN